ncbi:MAG: 30S ribosomal protein S6 [Firmicutes bacterium]|nr:30S ribosomal protein S6 [Bacillota bacterium]
MNQYEVLYILEAKLEDKARDAEIEKISSIVTENGGSVEKVDKWGIKKYAYPIDYKTEGFYALMTFSAPPALPLELERRMKISDAVVRYKVTKVG